MNRQFAIIGEHLTHTLSPQIHNELFRLSGKKASYKILEIPKGSLNDSFYELKKLDGFNITIPYKQDIINMCDKLDSTAEKYMAVNCISTNNGISTGYNTDAMGFLKALEVAHIPLNTSVLLLGCGGAGRMMAFEAAEHHADLTIAVRQKSILKAHNVINDILKVYPKTNCCVADIDTLTEKYNTILNSTPVGMFPHTNECPVKEEVIKNAQNIFDAIYNPFKTDLIKIANKHNINTAGGMTMLVWQAVMAHTIWDNQIYDINDINLLINKMEQTVKKVF